jgi:tetratricopeptide (TPR) repeat protein
MRELERSLWAGERPEQLRASLMELGQASAPGSRPWQFAFGHLAALLSPDDPWRASVVARRLLSFSPRDHVAWAVLALSQSLLGNVRYAIHCYEQALAIRPDEPRYSHNLGHLYDVALSRSDLALPLLERAHIADPRCADVAASYAHALGRAGRPAEGLALLRAATRSGATRDQAEVLAWLATPAPSPSVPPCSDGTDASGVGDDRPARRKRRRGAARG